MQQRATRRQEPAGAGLALPTSGLNATGLAVSRVERSPGRRSIRLSTYDYSSSGAYFVTIVSRRRMRLFGDVRDGTICLSAGGAAIWAAWETLPFRFPTVELDAFIVMPNQVHFIVWLANATAADRDPGRASPAPTLGDVVGAFKSLCARAVRLAGGRLGSLWQRNYYERIIRDERELHDVRRYVLDNPESWELDDENPDHALISARLP